MTFSDEVYDEMVKVVGDDNISKDPGILDSYCGHATYNGQPSPGWTKGVWWNRAAAAVLPGNTAEVQQIVKICNKYRVKFKPHSTGQCPGAFPQNVDCITMDLRRLNRIIEINEEHMYALIEPYISQGELYIECIKYGLAPHMIDAGASISPLASHTSVTGNGDSSITRGYNARNCLGVEWVLPNGDLVNIGTPDVSKSGWFSADGPGPSLVGVFRGGWGARGTRGVFTKAAVKLYPWHGPKKFEIGGVPPWYKMEQWPNSKIFIFKFEEYSKEIEGLYLIAEAEIFDSLGRLSTTKTEGILGKNKNEWARLRRSGYIQDMFPKAGWFAHVVAANKAQFDYSIDTMIKIAEKTGATIIDPDSDPNFVSRNPTIIKPIKSLTPKEYDTPEKILSLQQTLFQFLVIKNFTLKTCVMPMAGTNGPLPAFGYSTIDKLIGFMQDYQLPIKAKYQKMGKFLDDGPDGNWSTLDEGGHIMVYMNFTRNEPLDPNSEHLGLLLETFSKAVQEGFPPLRGMPPAEKSMIWSKYLTKIEDSLDPNNTRDRFWQDDLAMWLYKDHVEDTEKKQAKNTVGGL